MVFNKLKNVKISTNDIRKKINFKRHNKIMTEEEKKKKEEKIAKKELKKQSKKILKSNLDIIPFLDVDDKGIFSTKNGFLEIYQIESKDVYALNEDEAKVHMYYFIKFLRNYIDDIKLIGMNFPVNTLRQQEYIKKKIKNNNNPIYDKFLKQKLAQFEFLEGHRTNREFYVMIFIEDERDLDDRINTILRNQNVAIRLHKLDLEKKEKILFKLYNPNTKLIN